MKRIGNRMTTPKNKEDNWRWKEASYKRQVARARIGLVSSLSSVAVHLRYVVQPTSSWRQVCFCICRDKHNKLWYWATCVHDVAY